MHRKDPTYTIVIKNPVLPELTAAQKQKLAEIEERIAAAKQRKVINVPVFPGLNERQQAKLVEIAVGVHNAEHDATENAQDKINELIANQPDPEKIETEIKRVNEDALVFKKVRKKDKGCCGCFGAFFNLFKRKENDDESTKPFLSDYDRKENPRY